MEKNIQKDFLANGYDVVVFDCDSTLTEIEGINFLAKRVKKEKQVNFLTTQAMAGKIKFEDVFSLILNLIKPKSEDLDWLADQYIKHQINDAKNVINQLQKLGKKIYIISGGYEIPVKRFANHLGISEQNVFAIGLNFNNLGEYLGYDQENPLTTDLGKRYVLEKLSNIGSVLFIGDGATDLGAKNVVNLFVGFGGVVCHQIVKNNADIFINLKSLTPIVALAQGVKEKNYA
jgi:phosphoserine phosphatase